MIPSTIGCKPLQNVAKAPGDKSAVWIFFVLQANLGRCARHRKGADTHADENGEHRRPFGGH
nr:MAG TPA: hypothetical protein [Caudoviricetes sp.]DAX97601.1 MAG TPA: hypothetical protein [Caudoviricetes sp.]